MMRAAPAHAHKLAAMPTGELASAFIVTRARQSASGESKTSITAMQRMSGPQFWGPRETSAA